MFENLITTIASRAEQLREHVEAIFDQITGVVSEDNRSVSLTAEIDAAGISIGDLYTRATTLISLIGTITSASEEEFLLISAHPLGELQTNLIQASDEAQRTREALAVFLGGKVTAIDADTATLTGEKGVFPLTERLRALASFVDAALERVYRVRTVIGANGAADFSNLLDQLRKLTARANASDAEIKEACAHIKQARDETKNNLAKSNDTVKILHDLLAETQKEQEALRSQSTTNTQDISDLKKKAEALLENASETSARAKSLSDQIDTSREKLSAFEKNLDDRDRQFQTGSKNLGELLSSLITKNEEAVEIINNAKNALAWGTAEGLSTSFSEEAKKLDGQIWWGLAFFYLSLVMLAGWLVIVFFFAEKLHVQLPNLMPPKNPTVVAAVLDVITSIGTRFLLVAPALWFTTFTSHRYHELSLLREQFIFKKTVASAIPGFKQEATGAGADDYTRAMTTAAFERLLFNPRDRETVPTPITSKEGRISRYLVNIVKRGLDSSGISK